MPIVQVSIIEGRSLEKKTQMIAKITDVVAECMNAPKAAVRVLISEIPAAHWGVAGVPKSDPNKSDLKSDPKSDPKSEKAS